MQQGTCKQGTSSTPATDSMPRDRGPSGSGAAPEQEKKLPKCCLGLLYFSEARYAQQKPPVRMGQGASDGRKRAWVWTSSAAAAAAAAATSTVPSSWRSAVPFMH